MMKRQAHLLSPLQGSQSKAAGSLIRMQLTRRGEDNNSMNNSWSGSLKGCAMQVGLGPLVASGFRVGTRCKDLLSQGPALLTVRKTLVLLILLCSGLQYLCCCLDVPRAAPHC